MRINWTDWSQYTSLTFGLRVPVFSRTRSFNDVPSSQTTEATGASWTRTKEITLSLRRHTVIDVFSKRLEPFGHIGETSRTRCWTQDRETVADNVVMLRTRLRTLYAMIAVCFTTWICLGGGPLTSDQSNIASYKFRSRRRKWWKMRSGESKVLRLRVSLSRFRVFVKDCGDLWAFEWIL